MKRIYLVVSLCMLASFSFAQKKVVKEAKSAMGNTKEARELIKPALTNPETMNDAETWKIAGDIEYKMFDDELTKTRTQAITQKAGDEPTMYDGLFNLYAPYLKADSLAQLPDEKGKVKNKYRKDIIKNLKEAYPYYINGGLFYNDKRDYNKASLFFEKYWDMPKEAIFSEEQGAFNLQDTTYQTIKYYTILTAIQAENHKRAIDLMKKIQKEPYVANSTYKESDIYELLASEYQRTGDSIAFVNTLREGAEKFPANKYFTPNLINEYIRGGKNSEALAFLDQAIANDPSNSCDLKSVKATLYADKKDYATAEPLYQEALQSDANCERALEGIGVLYILKAQDNKEKASQVSTRKEQTEMDKETADLYLKAVPYLEKFRGLMKARNAEPREIRPTLVKLQNVYYNLSLLKVDKSKELEEIEKELGE